jgi:hypothetical protein
VEKLGSGARRDAVASSDELSKIYADNFLDE